MKNIIFVSLILALSTIGCLSGSSTYRSGYDFAAIDKVAIVSVEGAITSETAKDQIIDFFAQELIENGYAPIAREQIRNQLASVQMEGDFSSTGNATELGRILEVPAVIVVNIPNFDDTLTMTAKMIDVSDGSIIWMGSGSDKSGQSILNPFGESSSGGIQRELAFNFDNFGAQVNQSEPVNQPLSSEEAKIIQRLVSRICRSLPFKLNIEW